jgi:putative hydrolase of the HAD superfamily
MVLASYSAKTSITMSRRAMRGILLDLDDTLIDDRSSTHAALEAFLIAHQLDTAGREEVLVTWRAIAARHWQRYEAGEVSFLEQRRCRVRDFLGRQLTDEEADEAFSPYASEYERSWKLLPGVAEFLERTRHIPKVIITNGERDQQLRKVRATGLSKHVAGVVTPSDCGHWKPHPSIFLAGLAMLGAMAAECLMVGDDEVRDIEPARKLGMRCFIVERGHEKRDIRHLIVGA